MKNIAGRFPVSPALSWFVCVWCLSLFSGCPDHNIIPASQIVTGQVTVSWKNVSGANAYNIYFAGHAGLTKWNSVKIPNPSNPITVTDLVFGKTYYFGMTVVSESGESDILSEKSYQVKNKEGFVSFDDLILIVQSVKGPETKEPLPEGQVTLSWENVANAVSYNVYWSETPGVTKQNGKKIANVTNPYVIKGLQRGKTYYVVVTAVSNSQESKESEELSFSAK